MPPDLFQVASENKCGQNGTPVILSTHDITFYDEGQCPAGRWAAPGAGAGEGSADPAYGEKKKCKA